MSARIPLAFLLSAGLALPPASTALAQSADPAAAIVAEAVQIQDSRPRRPFAGLFKRRNRQPDAATPALGGAAIANGGGVIDLVPAGDVSAYATPDAGEPPAGKPKPKAFVLRLVSPDQVPLPNPNPRREAAVAEDEANVEIVTAVAEPEVEGDFVPEGEGDLPDQDAPIEPDAFPAEPAFIGEDQFTRPLEQGIEGGMTGYAATPLAVDPPRDAKVVEVAALGPDPSYLTSDFGVSDAGLVTGAGVVPIDEDMTTDLAEDESVIEDTFAEFESATASEPMAEVEAVTGFEADDSVEIGAEVEAEAKTETAGQPGMTAPESSQEPVASEAVAAPLPDPVVIDAEAAAPPPPAAPIETLESVVTESVAPASPFYGGVSDPTDASLSIEDRMEAERMIAAAQGDASPRMLVALLQGLQDRIAQGSVAAQAAQRRLRVRIDDVFATADASVWQDPRNALAAVTYVLSGGSPRILETFATLDPPPAVDERLSRGALAYVQGRQGEAAGLLIDLDVFALPASLGGQVAMAQAALIVGEDPRKALARLDQARLLAPGTLVEEAAIRRSIFVADQIRDQARFELLSRQYLQRFRHSVYAGNFRYRFAAGLTHLRLLDDPSQFHRLDWMLAELEPETRCGLYLTVASAALVKGKTLPAALAAQRAKVMCESGTPDFARARLYSGAALIVTPGALDAGLVDLFAVHASLLAPSDRALRETVMDIAASIETADDYDTLTVTAVVEETAEEQRILTRATELLAEIDEILGEVS